MQVIPRINISYSPGAYGNYIKWILYSLLVDEPLATPFRDSTSHDQQYISLDSQKNELFALDPCSVKQLEQDTHTVTLTHPRQDIEDDNFVDVVDKISTLVDYVIVPYFDPSNYLLGLHNWIFKVHKNQKSMYLQSIDRDDLEKGWGVETTQPLETIDRWIIREHASLTICENYNEFAQFNLRALHSISNCKPFLISELFYNFLPSIEYIRQFLKVDWIRDPQELVGFHRMNVNNQKYKNQDTIARLILNSVFDDTNFNWQSEDITLYTEAYIQRTLQHQGIMLKCNGLNQFPTSTDELIEVFA